MKLSVVMPAYNEIDTIEEIVARVQAVPVDKEILLIDNCSTDGTREKIQALEAPGVRVILQTRNMRKGNSVKKGIAAAQGDFLIIQDADLEYDPQDYLPLLEAAEQEGVYAVMGSRVLGLRREGKQLPVSIFSLGRQAINVWFALLFGKGLTDSASCYKLARREVLQGLTLRCESFDLDFELAAKFLKGARRAGQRVVEIPVHYYPRSVHEGKKIGWRDGFAALWTILRFRFTD
ncbi:glycosyltransferase family 2 protein [bacterium]|nr:glycosyltransferase family 2 protein [bacterium]